MALLSNKIKKSIKNQSLLLIIIGIVYFLLAVLLFLQKDMIMALVMLGMTVIYVAVAIIFLSLINR